MAKKKKKELFSTSLMSGPVNFAATHSPTLVIASATPTKRKGTSISSYGAGLSIQEQVLFWFQQQSLAGGMFPAFLYYGRAGLADPKAPAEAYGYGGFLGLSGWRRAAGGALMGGIIGFAVGGIIGVIVDPLHRHEGGWDETADYQETQRMYAETKAPWKTQYIPTQ